MSRIWVATWGLTRVTRLAGLLILFATSSHPITTLAGDTNQKEIDQVTIAVCEWHPIHQFVTYAVKEAYNRIGIQSTFNHYPCKRSMHTANAGIVDGEAGRIDGVTKKYRNLIQTSAPVITIEGIAFTKGSTRNIASFSDLTGLKIGIILGEIFATEGTKGLNPTAYHSYSDMLKDLATGKIDVAVGIKRAFKLENRHYMFRASGLHATGETLFSAPLYHLVHKRNKGLLPRLNKTLKAMWESGDTATIHKQTMKSLTQ